MTFLRGSALHPPPPVASRQEGARYFRIHEHDELDEGTLTNWLRQASERPGEKLF